MSLTRDQILGRRPATTAVNVPGWGGEVLVRKLSVAALNRYMAFEGKGVAGLLLLIVNSLCDDAGCLLFSEGDLSAMEDLDVSSVKALAQEVMRLNGMGKDAVDDAVKNSSPGPSADTSSS